MLNANILFSNLFRSANISRKRLYGFGVVVLQALSLANTSDQFTAIIARLTAALSALKKEISDVDINLTGQKTGTETVDSFIVSFYRFMSENEPFIARQLGGRSSAGFKAFFPFGLTEYSAATKTEMPTLTLRVKEAAVKYHSALEPVLSEQLQAFDGNYSKLYTAQQAQIQTVKSDQTDCNTASANAQMVLTEVVHLVGMQYPGDVEKCGSFFPFAMLYPHNKPESLTAEGNLAKGAIETLLNRQLLKKATIAITNTGTNATFAVWMASSPDAPMPANATVISATSNTVTLKAAAFGNLETHIFFMVKNLSDVNSCSYKVVFTGLKKKDEPVVETAAEPAVMEILSA